MYSYWLDLTYNAYWIFHNWNKCISIRLTWIDTKHQIREIDDEVYENFWWVADTNTATIFLVISVFRQWSLTEKPLISQLECVLPKCQETELRSEVSAKSFQVMKGQKSPHGDFYSVRSHRSVILSAFRHLFFEWVWRFTFFLKLLPWSTFSQSALSNSTSYRFPEWLSTVSAEKRP